MSYTTDGPVKLPIAEFPGSDYYDRDLREIIHYMREFEKILKQYAEVIESLSEALGDINGMKVDIADIKLQISDLNAMRTAIATMQTTIDQIIRKVEDIEIDMDSVYSYINTQLGSLRTLIEVNRKLFEGELSKVNFELTFQYNLLNQKVDRLFNKLIELIEQLVPTDVYNRVAGIRLSLDDNNFNVYEDLRCGGLTNAELSEFGISNDHIASIVLNNRDFAINLRKRLKLHYLFSPVSGKKVSHANAISQVIVLFGTNNHAGASNEGLYNKMLADAKTNDDISDYYTSNFGKYFWLVG